MTPSELKSYLGKKIWKALCANSVTRNRLILSSLKNPALYPDVQYRTKMLKDFDAQEYRKTLLANKRIERETLLDLITVKSTCLKYQKSVFSDFYPKYNLSKLFNWMQINKLPILVKYDGKYEFNPDFARDTLGRVGHINMLFNDTYRMAKKLNRPFSNQWSFKRMQKAHDDYSKEVTLQRLKNKDYQFELSDDILELKQLDLKDFGLPDVKLKLITTLHELAIEGAEMKHCVADYEGFIKQGVYAVLSLYNKRDNQRSTLGLNKPISANEYHIDQHYGRGNTSVESQRLKDAAGMIIDVLKKKDKLHF